MTPIDIRQNAPNILISGKLFSLIIGLLACLFIIGCQEEYHAELDIINRVLVVDALITDQNGPHTVKLTLAGRFQQDEIANPVYKASVFITDSDNNRFELSETLPGTYITPSYFFARQGLAYVLHIETREGMYYQSEPQVMAQPIEVDSIYGQLGKAVFYNRSLVSNRIYQTEIEGTYTFLQTSSKENTPVRYRFESTIYLQHSIPWSDVVVDNCWIKKPINNFLGTDISSHSGQESFRQIAGFAPFLPTDLKHLGVYDTLLFDNARVFINKVYALNDASYAYHKAKNEQINNNGRFFEPIAAQPPSNIKCITEPDRLVLGLFEVSPFIGLTYRVRLDYITRMIEIDIISSMDHIPDEGCMRNIYPAFWIN